MFRTETLPSCGYIIEDAVGIVMDFTIANNVFDDGRLLMLLGIAARGVRVSGFRFPLLPSMDQISGRDEIARPTLATVDPTTACRHGRATDDTVTHSKISSSPAA